MPAGIWRCINIIRKNRKYIYVGIVCILFVILAAISEKTETVFDSEGNLTRNDAGEGENTYDLLLEGEGIEERRYSVTVEEELLSEEAARNKIYEAEEEIDNTLYAGEDSASRVTQDINMRDSYMDGLVSAEWMLSDYDVISADGRINQDLVTDQGTLVEAQVELSCNDYRELYTFSFNVVQKELTKEEALIKGIDKAIDKESQKSGTNKFKLPDKVDGISIRWKEEKPNLVVKVIFLEVAVLVMFVIAQKENEKQQLKRRQDKMRLDYSDVVSKMAILLGAGMSVKQAWNRISARNSDKRNKNIDNKHPIYEEMLFTSREIQDGISERIAYQRFGERTGLGQYHRFSRLLIQNLQKGNRGLCAVLEEEAEHAFEERRLLAKKLGEEAGTKMLVPLMLMMMIVIAIVVVPAVLSF